MVHCCIWEGAAAHRQLRDNTLTCGGAWLQLRRTRHQMYQHINADYYGFRDDEDGVLEKVEAEAERNIRRRVRCLGCSFSVHSNHTDLRLP